MCLIADAASIVHWSWVILQVAAGLGAVIFVHELGHFAVAKMCGVKCEKFFIGFDIGGYKISRRWGETEYGIGILPLGGYVKMLGQDDNPANITEQMEKSQVTGEGKQIVGPDGQTYLVDPRSYLAKSVPQRMAIISAGVVMNVIFAFIFAAIAFGLGLPYMPCIISETMSGAPAWVADLRTGDEITQIAGRNNPSFTQLTGSVTLGDLEVGIPLDVRRGDSGDVQSITLKPQQERGLAKIGIVSPRSLRLHDQPPVVPGSAAARAEPPFAGGDEVLQVDGQEVADFREFAAILSARRSEPLAITVRRGGTADPQNAFAPRTDGQQITITVPPSRLNRLGLVMNMGPLVAVQENSPAAEAGLQPGDLIVLLDGERFDPLLLPLLLHRAAQDERPVQLTIRRRDNAQETDQAQQTDQDLEIEITPRVAGWLESSESVDAPLSAPALGIAYHLLNDVAGVVDNSPADRAELQPGDQLIAARLLVPNGDGSVEEQPVELGESRSWPMVMAALQRLPANIEVQLAIRRGDQDLTRSLVSEPDPDAQFFWIDRGFIFAPLQRIRVAESWQEQLQLASDATIESLLMVYKFLQKIGGQVPLTALGGPITIAKAAGFSAVEGPAKFLMFLTMLSANLAVINFLPIPLLDGGHMVFLAYEGIFRRPANERVVVALHTVGFVFIISLMLFVFALDLNLIPRNL